MLNVAYRNCRKLELLVPIGNSLADDLQLIAPNLHRRYSGVTATNRMVAPRLAKLFRAAWFGPDAPDGIARMGVGGRFERAGLSVGFSTCYICP